MSERMAPNEAANDPSLPDASSDYFADYVNLVGRGRASLGLERLLTTLAGSSAQDWLGCSRKLVLRGDIWATTEVLSAAHQTYPESTDIAVSLAGMYHQADRQADAENLLRPLLKLNPAHNAASFLLMHVLKKTGAMGAVANVAHSWFQQESHDIADIIQVVELLDECDRKQDALYICEATLLTQLGQFDLARQRYLFALAGDEHALEWNVATGLATLQRYEDRRHSDFGLFEAGLLRSDISDRARASLLFALGKACDDIGDYSEAAGYFRRANALCHSTIHWSRKLWRRGIEARVDRTSFSERSSKSLDWTPVFIVGMPRSGTTLLAELLSKQPKVSNRGELTLLQQLERRYASADGRQNGWRETAFALYEKQLRSEDPDAAWYIDKQPHNFMCVDLILAIFPNARIIYCQRNARDNALSLWSQYFLPGAQVFSYDFADIAAVMQGCKRLMTYWQKQYPSSIHTVQYEQLVTDSASCLGQLNTWLGIPDSHMPEEQNPTTSAKVISSASLWQARQPVHTRSVERWRHYAAYLPELLHLPAR
jgi:tetratricopeptide (TPR) repeat protein